MWIKVLNGVVVDVVSSSDDLSKKGYISVPLHADIQEGDSLSDFDIKNNWERIPAKKAEPSFFVNYQDLDSKLNKNLKLNYEDISLLSVKVDEYVNEITLLDVVQMLNSVVVSDKNKELFAKVVDTLFNYAQSRAVRFFDNFLYEKFFNTLVSSSLSRTASFFVVNNHYKKLSSYKAKKLLKLYVKVRNIQMRLSHSRNDFKNTIYTLLKELNALSGVQKTYTRISSCLIMPTQTS